MDKMIEKTTTEMPDSYFFDVLTCFIQDKKDIIERWVLKKEVFQNLNGGSPFLNIC